MHEHCMASVNMQNSSREQDSRREQNSPRYSGDYPVHRGLSFLREQDSPRWVGSNCVNKIVPGEQNRSKYEQNSPREQDRLRKQNSPCTAWSSCREESRIYTLFSF